ncbi:MAG: NAD(P)-dependent oxidoreductase [Candidatus Omnitrophica bacterium]|nr:NAD(P)-dependent oxidoreductase [Candidatus Omnitrophota bacterium]
MKQPTEWCGRRILITGGTGMVGSSLAVRLVQDGCRVWVLSRQETSRDRLKTIEEQIHFRAVDIRDALSLSAAIDEIRPEVVYHLASTPFNPPTVSGVTHMQVIAMGTVNILEALRDRPGIRIISTGSAAEYGSGARIREDQPLAPRTALGAAKAASTLLMQTYAALHRMETVVLRVFTPFGPWEKAERLVPHTILSALNGQDVSLSDGRQERDFFYIDDLVEALRLAAIKPVPPGSVINICSGRGIPVLELVELILRLMKKNVRAIPGALPTRPDEIWECSGDNSAAHRLLGWVPRTRLEEGLSKTIEWVTLHQDEVSGLNR